MTEESAAGARKHYLDNIRSFAILLVVAYHVAYLFNSAGVVSNFPVHGIRAVDSLCYFVYPWFMCLLFLAAGISARYSLQKRGAGRFARERARKLIVPLFGGIFLLQWIGGWVTEQFTDLFHVKGLPVFARYLIYCLNIGPLWFLPELFAVSMLLLLLRALDRRDRLWTFAGKANFPVVLLLFFPVWGSSFVLNTPMVVVFRNGIYWFLFLLGYYVFSHEEVLRTLKKWGVPLFVAGIALGCAEVWVFWGKNYTSSACLEHPLTNLYAWVMMLGILGFAQRFWDFSNRFTEYLRRSSFGIYVVHYPLLALGACFELLYLRLPMAAVYPLLLVYVYPATLLFYEITKRIPVIRVLLYGAGRPRGALPERKPAAV